MLCLLVGTARGRKLYEWSPVSIQTHATKATQQWKTQWSTQALLCVLDRFASLLKCRHPSSENANACCMGKVAIDIGVGIDFFWWNNYTTVDVGFDRRAIYNDWYITVCIRMPLIVQLSPSVHLPSWLITDNLWYYLSKVHQIRAMSKQTPSCFDITHVHRLVDAVVNFYHGCRLASVAWKIESIDLLAFCRAILTSCVTCVCAHRIATSVVLSLTSAMPIRQYERTVIYLGHNRPTAKH